MLLLAKATNAGCCVFFLAPSGYLRSVLLTEANYCYHHVIQLGHS